MLNNIWPGIGAALDETFETEYLFHQAFEPDNFMKLLIPPATYINKNGDVVDISDKFFGVKSLNIFIAQKPYGWIKTGTEWEWTWDDPLSTYSQEMQLEADRWIAMFGRFSSYRTIIYTDTYIASQIVALYPDSNIMDMMIQTGTRLEQFCEETVGFEYGGIISSQVEANFFEPVIQEFYGIE